MPYCPMQEWAYTNLTRASPCGRHTRLSPCHGEGFKARDGTLHAATCIHTPLCQLTEPDGQYNTPRPQIRLKRFVKISGQRMTFDRTYSITGSDVQLRKDRTLLWACRSTPPMVLLSLERRREPHLQNDAAATPSPTANLSPTHPIIHALAVSGFVSALESSGRTGTPRSASRAPVATPSCLRALVVGST